MTKIVVWVVLATHPFVEELRSECARTVTFVHRYFPLPGHRSSVNAAVAGEAAAPQSAYASVYQTMYATQAQSWGIRRGRERGLPRLRRRGGPGHGRLRQ